MSDQKQGQKPENVRRKQRLAKALKANMSKRKVQAKARTAATPPPTKKPLNEKPPED